MLNRYKYIFLLLAIISGLQGLCAEELEFWQEQGLRAALSFEDEKITFVATEHKRLLLERAEDNLPLLEISNIDILIDMLKGESFNDRYPAALTLAALGPLSAERSYHLAELAGSGDAAIRYYAALALEGSAPLIAETVIPFINASLRFPDYREELLFDAIYLSGGNRRVVELIRLLESTEKLTESQLEQLNEYLKTGSGYLELQQRLEQIKEENKEANPVIFRILLLVIATVAIFVIRRVVKR